MEKTLPPADIILCQRLVEPEMEQLSYDSVSIQLYHWFKIPFLITRSTFEFLNRLYGRWKLGGSAYLLNVLCNYIKHLIKIING